MASDDGFVPYDKARKDAFNEGVEAAADLMKDFGWIVKQIRELKR